MTSETPMIKFTSGQILPDGRILDLISGHNPDSPLRLVAWDGESATISENFSGQKCTYSASECQPALLRAIRLPSHYAGYGSTRKLFISLATSLKDCSGVSVPESWLLAAFCLSTWVADRLLVAPELAIVAGDQATGIDLLRLLHSLCRRSLLLAEVTTGVLQALPADLPLTLLVGDGTMKRNVERLLRVTNYRGVHVPVKGRLMLLHGSKAILRTSQTSLENVGEGAIRISLDSCSRSLELTDGRLDEIAAFFQPRMLMYRLKNLKTVAESDIDVSTLSRSTARLARELAARFPADKDLAREVTELLRPQDEDLRAQCFLDSNYVLTEVLLAEIHSRNRNRLRVDELAKDLSAHLRSRGEIRDWTAEQLGWRLSQLGIPRASDREGRYVAVNLENSRRVHAIARDLAPDIPASPGCPECLPHDELSSP
jgi:hypothetical protein